MKCTSQKSLRSSFSFSYQSYLKVAIHSYMTFLFNLNIELKMSKYSVFSRDLQNKHFRVPNPVCPVPFAALAMASLKCLEFFIGR